MPPLVEKMEAVATNLREHIAYRSSLANLAALNTFTYPSSYSMKRLGAFYPNGTGCQFQGMLSFV